MGRLALLLCAGSCVLFGCDPNRSGSFAYDASATVPNTPTVEPRADDTRGRTNLQPSDRVDEDMSGASTNVNGASGPQAGSAGLGNGSGSTGAPAGNATPSNGAPGSDGYGTFVPGPGTPGGIAPVMPTNAPYSSPTSTTTAGGAYPATRTSTANPAPSSAPTTSPAPTATTTTTVRSTPTAAPASPTTTATAPSNPPPSPGGTTNP